MKYSITVHKAIAIVSFLILLAVQFFLVYNTYQLKDKQYYLEEKDILKKEYGNSIRSDLMFPGGGKILDTAIYNNLDKMEHLFRSNRRQFEAYTQYLLDSTVHVLRRAENIDSLISFIRKKHAIHPKLAYRLSIDVLEVVFGDKKYIALYNKGTFYPGIADSLQLASGLWLGGDLEEVSENNKVVSVSVGGIADRTYRITFSLYVDTPHRKWTILQHMMPTFALSLFAILVVILLFFITLRNWIRQKKLSEMKSDFIHSITHELHTPLAAIIVANRTLQNDKIRVSRETVQPLTEVIERQSDRLKALIGQVLDITTMNQVSLKKEPHSLHHLLDEILLDYRLKLSGTPVVLNLIRHAASDEVLLDPFWFTTVLLNILDNAIKYNQQDLKEITVSTANDKKNILVSIADNGIGMTPETQKHIFEKFYRDTQLLNGPTKGLGLGLYYARQAINAHNWKIDIASLPGEGSVFTITIPLV
jgi:two-component system phosphate regulon sensor histidine kinase PhoR